MSDKYMFAETPKGKRSLFIPWNSGELEETLAKGPREVVLVLLSSAPNLAVILFVQNRTGNHHEV